MVMSSGREGASAASWIEDRRFWTYGETGSVMEQDVAIDLIWETIKDKGLAEGTIGVAAECVGPPSLLAIRFPPPDPALERPLFTVHLLPAGTHPMWHLRWPLGQSVRGSLRRRLGPRRAGVGRCFLAACGCAKAWKFRPTPGRLDQLRPVPATGRVISATRRRHQS